MAAALLIRGGAVGLRRMPSGLRSGGRAMAAAVRPPPIPTDSCRQAGLSFDSINERVRAAEYAVIRAGEMDAALSRGEKLNFENIIYCNIGNPHSVGQTPLSFHRQVLALCMYPPMMDQPSVVDNFPPDAVTRAKSILAGTGGNGLGAYSHSKGVGHVRDSVAGFISDRDGFAADPETIFLTNGVGRLMDMLIGAPTDGVMIPIPQYPLYSAGLTLRGGSAVPYYLDEAQGWGLSIAGLAEALEKARAEGTAVKALVVINPGNPTGQLLSYDNMAEIVEFCHDQGLVLCADEVYQENIYVDDRKFHSFRKVMLEADKPVQLFSFHSTSKGYFGECGMRGGYFEALNLPEDVMAELYKLSSISLCSNLPGQVMVDLMVNPPKLTDPSGELFAQQRDDQLASLRRRAERLAEGLNSLTGVSSNQSEAAMYAFPSITLPPKAVAAAEAVGKSPDTFYALALLEVPGSGFGQVDGTWHFRTTFLPPEDAMDAVVDRMRTFHEAFMTQYE